MIDRDLSIGQILLGYAYIYRDRLKLLMKRRELEDETVLTITKILYDEFKAEE